MYQMNPKETLSAGSMLWPLLSNPFTLMVAAGIGGGLLISKLLDDNDNRSEPLESVSEAVNTPLDEPYTQPLTTVEETVNSTVEEPLDDAFEEDEISPSDEDLKREMIRQTMSELGKRSAAARHKKKEEDLRHRRCDM